MKRWVALLTAPVLLGAIVATLLWVGVLDNPILLIKADVGTALLLLGLVVSAGVGAYCLAQRQAGRARQSATEEAVHDRLRFLSRLDHELKNPLMAIRAGLANLTILSADSLQQEALQSVNNQVLRLSRLVADLRKLAELEKQPIEQGPVDMTTLLQEVVALAAERPEAEKVALRLALPEAPWPLPPIRGDGDLLFMALHNLLDNAIKFSQGTGTIEVRAIEDGPMVMIEVADTGPGIPEEDIPHVWEELYRSESAREIPGSGLGLALVRAIVRRHNGTIALRSRLGRGTVVTVRLPIH
ncbi:MAG: hypothetical protein Kow00124_13170 [Anaerolineae bacterium]